MNSATESNDSILGEPSAPMSRNLKLVSELRGQAEPQLKILICDKMFSLPAERGVELNSRSETSQDHLTRNIDRTIWTKNLDALPTVLKVASVFVVGGILGFIIGRGHKSDY